MQEIRKIVILGPESTGKSTLCEQLATHYNTVWCPEFAREYLLTHGTKYTFTDLLVIAKGQVALEEQFVSKAIEQWETTGRKTAWPILFEDTDMHVMKVWCEYVFGKSHSYVEEKIAESSADLYLLCNTDLPWVKDELREYPDVERREELYDIYKKMLINENVRWTSISGSYEERLLNAVKATDDLLNAD